MRRLLAPVLLLLAALALAHPAQAQEPGLSDSEIVLGMWTCLTGPTALLGTSARDGVQVWVNEINEAGGIHGRKLRLVVYDSGDHILDSTVLLDKFRWLPKCPIVGTGPVGKMQAPGEDKVFTAPSAAAMSGCPLQ